MCEWRGLGALVEQLLLRESAEGCLMEAVPYSGSGPDAGLEPVAAGRGNAGSAEAASPSMGGATLFPGDGVASL